MKRKPRILFILSNWLGNSFYSKRIYEAVKNLQYINKEFIFIEVEDYNRFSIPGVIRKSGALTIAWITNKKFSKKFKKFPFDGLFCCTWEPILGLWRYCKNVPKAVVTDVPPLNFAKLNANHLSKRNEWNAKNICKHFFKIHIMHQIYKNVLKNVDYFYPWSKWCADCLKDDYRIRPEKIEILPCPIDTSHWCPTKNGINKYKPTILFVGDFERKNGQFLVNIYRKYLRESCFLKIISMNDMSSRTFPDSVHLINTWLSQKELLEAFQNSDLFVMPSTREAFSIAIRQAISVGLPVITTDILSGVREIVKNGVNGYRLPYGDEKLWAEKIKNLIDDKYLRKKMAQNARKLALEKFSIDAFNFKMKEAVRKISNIQSEYSYKIIETIKDTQLFVEGVKQ